MRALIFEEFKPDMLVTVLQGPYREVTRQHSIFDGGPAAEPETVEDKTYQGHVFKLASWMPPFMQLAPLCPQALIVQRRTRSQRVQHVGPFAILAGGDEMGPQHVPTALIFNQDDIKVMPVTEMYACAYRRHWANADQPKKQSAAPSGVRALLASQGHDCDDCDHSDGCPFKDNEE